MSNGVLLEVDDDGFFCLVAPDAYRAFVDEDWQFQQLLTHFVGQMNAGSLFVAYPGSDDANETVALVDGRFDAPALREVSSAIHVGAGGLWVTDYAQLTMAAQFDDEAPMASGAIRLPVHEGWQRVILRQVDSKPRYVVTIGPFVDDDRKQHSAVPWFS